VLELTEVWESVPKAEKVWQLVTKAEKVKESVQILRKCAIVKKFALSRESVHKAEKVQENLIKSA
jgi:hypothetical protein